ncbi:hypothetical protein BJY21_002748 [Kineosphaera limosa]|uniref:Uncharacterized protein n=1 Tax=Kineosphaera limosa NBRC 100340 TaxID=1184609 RepID=K6X023_9MICO|nr:hypothetical protein [Kineosphaera limosa]NYE01564.1 hypothetical protein [Kineosphaera limosa]GAB97707.1 hypothetical protein KILIM_079_00050 [Kineosphaera limosa NBRC 100340]
MALGDFLARLGGRAEQPAPEPEVDRPPTADALQEALAQTERLVDDGSVPSPVTARVLRITATVRDTIPRLDALGAGSDKAYSVMATATDYLPEAVGGYLRLPRRFADTRPVDGPKTALMVLVDQLDLLGGTMDAVFDAVCRDDANALVAHGRFLSEKFGAGSRGGELEVHGIAVPPQPSDTTSGDSTSGGTQPGDPQPVGAAHTPPPANEEQEPASDGSSPKQSSEQPPAAPRVEPLRPPSSLDL